MRKRQRRCMSVSYQRRPGHVKAPPFLAVFFHRQTGGVPVMSAPMPPDNSPRTRALRMLMMMDATVLVALGLALLCCPVQITAAFGFKSLPPAMFYLLGLWGAALLTLGIGYGIAAVDPTRHRLWVCIGIARGAAEAIFGWCCLSRGLVTWQQSGLGILLAAFIALAYLVLYPRQPAID